MHEINKDLYFISRLLKYIANYFECPTVIYTTSMYNLYFYPTVQGNYKIQ